VLRQRFAPSVNFTTDRIYFTVEETVDHLDHGSKRKIFNITTVFFLEICNSHFPSGPQLTGNPQIPNRLIPTENTKYISNLSIVELEKLCREIVNSFQ